MRQSPRAQAYATACVLIASIPAPRLNFAANTEPAYQGPVALDVFIA
jgi:hypothetical protein